MIVVELYCNFHKTSFHREHWFRYEYNPKKIDPNDKKYKAMCCECQELYSIHYDLEYILNPKVKIEDMKYLGYTYEQVFNEKNILTEKCNEDFFNVRKLMSPKKRKLKNKSRKRRNK